MAAPVESSQITKFPKGVSSFGMPIIGGGAYPTTGRVLFVDSTASGKGDDSAHGTEPTTPCATLDYTIGLCGANRGDIIFLLPGHAETIIGAGGISADVAGIRIVGLGHGQARPKFTFQTSTAASLAVNAANIWIENLVFDFTGIDGLVSPIDVNAADFTLTNCEVLFADAGGQAAQVIVTDSNASRMQVVSNRFYGSVDVGCNSVVEIIGAPDAIEIRNNVFEGAFTSGAIYASALETYTNIKVLSNYVRRLAGGGMCIALYGTAGTGLIAYNAVVATTYAYMIADAGYVALVENYGYLSGDTNQIGTLVPVAGSYLAANRTLVDEIIGAEMSYNRANYIAVTCNLSLVAWNTVASHEVLQVTGLCRIKIIPVCMAPITSGGGITMTFGTDVVGAAFIASTTGTDIDTGEIWLSASPKGAYTRQAEVIDVVVYDEDIGYTIGVAAATAGTLVFHCWWEPLDGSGAVVAGTGSSL